MEISDIFKVGSSILASLGGATLILFAFSSWLGKVWANRILESEKNKLSAELESIKISNQNFVNAIGVSNTLYIESQKAFANERVNATKNLWSQLIDLRNNKSSAVMFLDVLTFKEYYQIHNNPKLLFFDEELSEKNLCKTLNADIDILRPFIDEKAYAYFWSYRALIGRLSIYIKKIREYGQPVIPWQEDIGVNEILKPIFSKDEFDKLKNEKWDTQTLFNYIETVLAEHLRFLASGAELSRESLKHSISINKAAESLRKIEEKEKLTSRPS